MANGNSKLDYDAIVEQVGALNDEFTGLRKSIVNHIIPQPGMKALRASTTEWVDDILTDLQDLHVRLSEAATVYKVDEQVAEGEPVDQAVEAAVAAATGEGESSEGESSEGESSEGEAKPRQAQNKSRKPAAVPA